MKTEADWLREDYEELKDAASKLLAEMHDYYFEEGDEELRQVNRLRRILGMREQMPKCCEAEAQADLAENKTVQEHEEYHNRIQGGVRVNGKTHDVMTAKEVGIFLGFNAVTVRLKAAKGEIPGRKIGKEWRFSRRGLLAWIEGEPPEHERIRAKLLDACHKMYGVCDAVYSGESVNMFTVTDMLEGVINRAEGRTG